MSVGALIIGVWRVFIEAGLSVSLLKQALHNVASMLWLTSKPLKLIGLGGVIGAGTR